MRNFTPKIEIYLNLKNKTHLLLVTVLFLFCFSFTGFSQETEVNKPFLVTKTSSMRYVEPLSSKQSLIPYEYVEKEAKDGRSREYEYCEGTGTFGDDVLTLNPKPLNETRQGRAPSLVFDAYVAGGSPTDPSGAVGPNHYFTVFNTGFIIYDKLGNALTGQLAVTNIFSAGGCCDLTVSYDNAADRWVVSYLFSSGGAEIAVSDGPNPVTAGWNVYTISAINDYQKLSVWSDGYYITENTGATNKIYALERDEMLAGNPAAQILGFQLPGIVTNGFFSPQAFNVSNSDLPATGSLPIVYMYDNNWGGGGSDHIKLWEVDVDWVTPGNSGISSSPQQINVSAFNSLFDNGSFSNLAQPSGGVSIDALQATIMNQAQFRRFAGHNSAVFNFVVDVDGSATKQAGIRWMEFRQNGDGLPWSLFQEGTYTAADNKHAWNASLAMDDQGNIGMGYTGMSSPNSSNSNVRVSSFYTGRLSGDTAGTMSIAEETIAIGNGLFTNERYGDYSKIDVDPSDDQTFWFIDEYINSSRKGVVGVFKIASLPAGALVSFDNASGNVDEGFGNDCFVDLNVPLSISQAPTADADVTFNIDGASTTTTGFDFELLTPTLTFPSGLTGSQNMVLRIFHDGLIEIDETLTIDFTVFNNSGDGAANTLADTFNLTITSSDAVTIPSANVAIYDEDFEDGSFDGTTTGNTGSDLWATGNAAAATSSFWTTTGNLTQFGFTNDDACNCDKGNDLLTTTAFSLVGPYTAATLTFDHAFSDVSPEVGDVLISTGGAFTSVQTLSNTSTGGSAKTTPWVNGISIDMTSYIGQANVRVRFRYNDGAGWLYGMAVDNILVTAAFSRQVQTAVNPASSYNSNINGLGTIYNTDVASGNAMCDITNNDTHDYGCTDVWVSRDGTGAQPYNGSVSPDFVMNKTFTTQPTNQASPGDVTITFYFTEAEISGWEMAIGGAPAVGVERNNLVAGRENSGTLAEVSSPLIIGSFGTDVTLTGTFTGLADTFYFGPVEAFTVACSGLTKTWNGAWSPIGDPDSSNPVIISAPYNTTTHGNITACSINIESGNLLIVTDGGFLDIQEDIIVDGVLDVQHQGSVVQRDDAASTTNGGSITVRKLTPNLGPKGFMILGSPMSGETREGVYGSGRRVLNHRTDLFVPNGAVGGTTENFVDDNNNNWEIKNGALTLAEGYLVKPQAPGNPPVGGQFPLDYTLGTLNNGLVTYDLLYNGSRLSSPNMLGNPYASAIDIDLFLGGNPLLDAVYYWQHITPPVQTFPGFNQLNFNLGDISVYNEGSGGTAAQNGGGVPTQFMASGQGFGVKALGLGQAIFNNSMRVETPNTDYRQNNSDRQRIWLDLKSEAYDYISSNMLVAFTEGATDDFEGKYDSKRFDTPISLFSVLDSNEELAIQGRTAFNQDQEVQLGFSTMVDEATTYSISIRQIEGDDISEATVYLHDKVLNVVTNLSETDYVFTSGAVYQTDRFALLFQNRVLSNNDIALQNISMLPNPTTGVLTVNSPNADVRQIEVIDLQGRVISLKQYDSSNQYLVDLSNFRSAMYFVKVYTSEGTLIKRVIKE